MATLQFRNFNQRRKATSFLFFLSFVLLEKPHTNALFLPYTQAAEKQSPIFRKEKKKKISEETNLFL